MTSMKNFLLGLGVVALYALHQDIWFWDVAQPLVFGFLPVGLFYHAVYSVAIALFMILLVRVAWPAELEREVERESPDSAEDVS
jgi:hypothetical protein|tara:strand:- start:562 stop:813 length:252 start_codon:yes stop_codon:yes gene_type:complete